jgi:signal transduction histidine kinase/ligand-binding sensor domain-containing protein
VATLVSCAVALAAPGHAEPGSGWLVRPIAGAGDVAAVAEGRAPRDAGALWLGSSYGLVRFDGARFERIPFDGSPSGSRAVRRIAIAPDGRPWIATGEAQLQPAPDARGSFVDWRGRPGGLFVLGDDGRLRPHPSAARLPSAWIWAIAFDREGAAWIGTEAGLARLRGDDVRVFGSADGLPGPLVTALAPGRGPGEPTMWVGTSGGLARIDGDELTRVPGPPWVTGFTGDPPVAVGGRALHDRQGHALGGTPPGGIEAALVAHDGARWLVRGATLLRLAPGATTPDLVMQDLGGTARALVEDAEGTVWLASSAFGLLRLRPSPVLAVSLPWPDATTFGMLIARDGTRWFSTTRGVAALAPSGAVRSWPVGDALANWSPRALAELPDGRILLTSNGDRLVVFADGRWRAAKGAGTERVIGTLLTRSGDLIAASATGILRFPAGDVDAPGRPVDGTDGACAGEVGPMLETRDGTLLVGTRHGGLTIARDGRARCLTTRDGLPSDRIASLHEDHDGAVWVGSLDPVGLALLRGGRVAAVIGDEGDGPGRVFGVARDARGGFWITSDKGVAVVPSRDLEARIADGRTPLAWRRFRAHDGLPHDVCMSWFGPTLLTDEAGRLLVATLLGPAQVDPARIPPRAAPVLAIDRVLGDDGRPLGITRAGPVVRAAISAGANPLDVAFTATKLLDVEALTFRYRFEPLDRDWIDAGSSRNVHVTRLPGAGRSTLVVQAFDADLPIGSPARLELDVLPPPWQRAHVVGTAALALAGLAWLAHRVRLRRVEARYRIIAEERARIARDLHDGLAQGFASIAFHLDALKLALGAAAPPMAEKFLARVRAVVDRSRTDAHRAVWNLRAQAPERLSVAGAIDRVVARAADETRAAVRFRLEGAEPAAGASTAELEHELPLVTQEAITNAVRHGGAQHVDVVLRNDGRELALTVEDDGCGFDPAAPRPPAAPGRGGFGLVGIQERATRLGGRVEIVASVGHGARITVQVPLDRPTPVLETEAKPA